VAKVSAEEDFEGLSEAEQHELKQELEADQHSLEEADSREDLPSRLAVDQQDRIADEDNKGQARGW